MLKLLIKKQLMEIFRSYFYDPKRNTRRKRSGTVAFFVLYITVMVGILGGMFTFLAVILCKPLVEVGMGWLYFALTGMIAIALGAFGSVFSTYSGLYLAKDNDLLLSLPIPVGAVIASRLLSVYLLGLAYSAVVSLPSAIVYLVNFFSVKALLGSLLGVFLISIFVATLSCLLGLVIARISQRLKNKSFITVIISVAFIALYYLFYFKAQSLITELIQNASLYGESIRGNAYIIYLLGRSGEGDPTAIFAATAIVAFLALIVWRLLSHSFIGIAASTGEVKRSTAAKKRAKQLSLSDALLKQELMRFTSSANYMLNCGLGTLMLVISAVLVFVKGEMLTEMLEMSFGRSGGAVILCAGVCLIASMNTISAPSVSLEGRTLWIKQSLPISGLQVLTAKLKLHFLLTAIPALLCALAIPRAVSVSVFELLLILLLVASFSLFGAMLGLILGMQNPSFVWTNEQVAIKQNIHALVALFGGWLIAAAIGGAYLLIGHRLGAAGYLAVDCLIFAALDFIMWRQLKNNSSMKFSEL